MGGSCEGRSVEAGRAVRRAPFTHKDCPSPYAGREGDASGDKSSLAKLRSRDRGAAWKGSTQEVDAGTRRNLQILPGLVGMVSGKPNATWS